MTYENRLPVNYAFGTLTSAAAISDTTLTSTDFATYLPSGLSTTNYVPLTLQDPSTHNYEIVWVNAHTASATTCTVVRGKEGSSARAWGSGTLWTIAPTLRDGVLWVTTRANLPTDPHVGLRSYIQDEQVTVERTLSQGWVSTFPNAGPRAHVRQSVLQSIPNNTFTPILWNTEDFDVIPSHDTSSNTSRYVVQTGWAGKYLLTGGVTFAVNANFSRGCAWYKNGSLITATEAMIAASGGLVTTSVTAKTIVVQLAVADYVELSAYQNTGGALDAVANGSSMTVLYLGP